MSARVIAVGDVHGCLAPLRTLMEAIAPVAGDTVVLLGDLVNRGPDSAGVLNWVHEYNGPAELVVLRGNHDDMMLEARRSLAEDEDADAASMWIAMGGRETLASYTGCPPAELGPPLAQQFAAIPDRHWDVLEASRPFFETDDTIFVHAVPDASLPMDAQSEDDLYWRKLHDFPPRHCSGKRVVCGHTAQKSGRPKWNADWVCIDTDAARGGPLTALEVGVDRVTQVDHAGRVTVRPLHEF